MEMYKAMQRSDNKSAKHTAGIPVEYVYGIPVQTPFGTAMVPMQLDANVANGVPSTEATFVVAELVLVEPSTVQRVRFNDNDKLMDIPTDCSGIGSLSIRYDPCLVCPVFNSQLGCRRFENEKKSTEEEK